MATTKGIEHLRLKINTDYVEHVPRYEHLAGASALRSITLRAGYRTGSFWCSAAVGKTGLCISAKRKLRTPQPRIMSISNSYAYPESQVRPYPISPVGN